MKAAQVVEALGDMGGSIRSTQINSRQSLLNGTRGYRTGDGTFRLAPRWGTWNGPRRCSKTAGALKEMDNRASSGRHNHYYAPLAVIDLDGTAFGNFKSLGSFPALGPRFP